MSFPTRLTRAQEDSRVHITRGAATSRQAMQASDRRLRSRLSTMLARIGESRSDKKSENQHLGLDDRNWAQSRRTVFGCVMSANHPKRTSAIERLFEKVRMRTGGPFSDRPSCFSWLL